MNVSSAIQKEMDIFFIEHDDISHKVESFCKAFSNAQTSIAEFLAVVDRLLQRFFLVSRYPFL